VVAPAPAAADQPAPAGPATTGPAPARAAVARPQPSPGALSRGFVTDYGYVINELKRILLLTAVILLLLFALWLAIG
jgi:hypothetical protein